MPEDDHSHIQTIPILSHSQSFPLRQDMASFVDARPVVEISPFDRLCKIQSNTRTMLLDYCSLIDKTLSSEKLVKKQEINQSVEGIQEKYHTIMKNLQALPLNEDTMLEQHEKDVINRHRIATSKFKNALENAMIWKKQIHSAINFELQSKQ